MNTLNIIDNPESGKPFPEKARDIWKSVHCGYKTKPLGYKPDFSKVPPGPQQDAITHMIQFRIERIRLDELKKLVSHD